MASYHSLPSPTSIDNDNNNSPWSSSSTSRRAPHEPSTSSSTARASGSREAHSILSQEQVHSRSRNRDPFASSSTSSSSSSSYYPFASASMAAAAAAAVPVNDPLSPASSNGGSPMTFYTPAMASLADTPEPSMSLENASGRWRRSTGMDTPRKPDNSRAPSHGAEALVDQGDHDLGDRTIILTEPTPQKHMDERQGKRNVSPSSLGRDSRHGPAYHHAAGASFDSSASWTSSNGYEDAVAETDESKRVEENLKKWAEREKLRRAKTRSKQPSIVANAPPPPTVVSDSLAAVSGLARKVSNRTARSGSFRHVRNESSASAVSGKGKSAREGSNAEAVELQIQIPQHPGRASQASASPTGSSSNAGSGQSQPVTPTTVWPNGGSVISPFDDRAERAARTGSRFIEDLEDPEVREVDLQASRPGGGVQSYASLHSNPTTPLASPTKTGAPAGAHIFGTSPGPKQAPPSTGKSKFKIRPPGLRMNSFASVSSFRTFDSKETVTPGQANGHLLDNSKLLAFPDTARSSIASPTDVAFPTSYLGNIGQEDEARLRLVGSSRPSTDDPYAYNYQYPYSYNHQRPDQQERHYDSYVGQPRKVTWLEYILCCGCLAGLGPTDDDEEQAGRTFPE